MASAMTNMTNKTNTTNMICGLKNQGATCYLNSAIQILFATTKFKNLILDWKYDKVQHGNAEFSIPLNLQILFRSMDYFKDVTLSTVGLTNSFGWEPKDCYVQQACDEFLLVLFDSLNETISTTDNTNKKNIVTSLFTGSTCDLLESNNSKYKSVSCTEFSIFQITIPNQPNQPNHYSLKQLMYDNFNEETVTDVLDPELNKKVNMFKLGCFMKLPPYLFLKINRFNYFDDEINKVPMIVDYEFELNNAKYMLYGVVMFVGNNISCGHYYTYVRHNNHTWYKCNDSVIEYATIEEVLYNAFGLNIDNCGHACILTYEKQD